jgi:hypothetical protein
VTYVQGGWEPAEEDEFPHEDEDGNTIGASGRKRKSSARSRRKKDRRLFRGTPWDKK